MDKCRLGGHDLTPENVYEKPNGRRECRACRRDHMLARRRRLGLGTRPTVLTKDRDISYVTASRPGALVYFITDGMGHVKIGTAASARQLVVRLADLQTGNALVLEVYATVPGSHKVENEIHRRFAHLRVRGEWFRLDAEIKDWLE